MEPLKVFYSYAHEDRDLCQELKKHLIPLTRSGRIIDWYDRMISPGTEWAKQIDDYLNSAQIIVLLISADFLASDYCWSVEMKRAIERHEKGEARVVPVILRHCYWQDAPFSKLQCLPDGAKAVTKWSDRDEAFANIVEGIKKVALELQQIEQEREQRRIEEQQRKEERRQIEEQRRRQEEQRRIEEQQRQEEEQRIELQRRPDKQRQAGDKQHNPATTTETGKIFRPHWLIVSILGSVAAILGIWIAYNLWTPDRELGPVVSVDRELGPVVSAPVDREPQNIHGWAAEQVQALQKQTAQALGKTPEFGDTLSDGTRGPKMVVIPAGEFMMGSPSSEGGRFDNERQHRVQIERDFAIGKHEVTFSQYDRFCEATGRKKPDDRGWGRGNWPVINVSWKDALAYAEWLSGQTGQTYRLPTEAEWEYAARAGTKTAYWWGDDMGRNKANCSGCGSDWDYKGTAPVGSFPANPFGLHDTVGNVWEWTCSAYDENYEGEERECISNNRANSSGVRLVIRGGSWGNWPRNVRSANRGWDAPGDRSGDAGFRLARPF